MAAGFPLELLCQLVLGYAAFKALKAAPPPRTRRKANENADVPRPNAPANHAEVLRRRKIKQILKAWLVYLIAIRLERVLDTLCGWWFPFYPTLRALLLCSYAFCYISFGEIAYSHILVPALKPYERTMNWIYGFAIDILDILYFIVSSAVLAAASPFLAVFRRTKLAWKLWSNDATEADRSVEDSLVNASASQHPAKTPKLKRTRKARLSMMATPHVPGHFVASLQDGDESIQPPIRPRLHPSERSLDDIPAFMEAMDRAQAAFYEEEEASRTQNGAVEQERVSEHRQADSGTVSAKRSRRIDNEQARNDQADEEEVGSSPRKKRKVTLKAAPVKPPSTDVPETRARPSAKALGKRKAASQDLDDVQEEDSSMPSRKRSTAVQQQTATMPSKTAASGSRLPRRTAAVTRSSTQANISDNLPMPVIDQKAQLAREVAAAARRAARQPREPAPRASARRKKAA